MLEKHEKDIQTSFIIQYYYYYYTFESRYSVVIGLALEFSIDILELLEREPWLCFARLHARKLSKALIKRMLLITEIYRDFFL